MYIYRYIHAEIYYPLRTVMLMIFSDRMYVSVTMHDLLVNFLAARKKFRRAEEASSMWRLKWPRVVGRG